MDRAALLAQMRGKAPKIHCLTNPVTMQDVANILLAAGGSAIMAQHPAEVEEITGFCQGTLLNTGVPSEEKFRACMAAGRRANELGHPVVLDPVGVGASRFRKDGMESLLKAVRPTLIRCNQEEACVLLHMRREGVGGVESAVSVSREEQKELARRLASAYSCTALISGSADVISDGSRTELVTGGDQRTARITGCGCMLSALCALFCGAGIPAYEAAVLASGIWKRSAELAGRQTDERQGGMGSFHSLLFDALDRVCHEEEEDESRDA